MDFAEIAARTVEQDARWGQRCETGEEEPLASNGDRDTQSARRWSSNDTRNANLSAIK